jgi:hypothetical protein
MQLRLISGIVWLLIGIPLLAMNLTNTPILGLEPGNLTLSLGLLAVALGIFRLWVAATIRKRRNPPPPPVRRRVSGPTLEYNPDFDFNRPGPRTIADNGDATA